MSAPDRLSPIERSRVDDARKSAEAALDVYAREDVEHELALRIAQMVRLVDRLAPEPATAGDPQPGAS